MIFTSTPIVRGVDVPLWYGGCTTNGPTCAATVDFDEDLSFNATASFDSQCFDTSYSTPTWGPFNATSSSSSLSGITYQTRVATSCAGSFTSFDTATLGGPILSGQQQVIKYRANFTHKGSTDAPASHLSAQLQHATTGQFRTQCIQPGSGITSWGILSCSEVTSGAGDIVYYATSAATCATLPSVNPTEWQTSVTNNATLSISTNAAIYIGFRSLIGSATDQAQVDACTTYWNEGIPAQPVWGVFNSFNNSIYWTATTTNSTTSDRLLRLDLNGFRWWPFDIAATALSSIGNFVYFGSSSGAFWNKFAPGGVFTDNGSNINAFWRSKDFGGADPFNETSWRRISVIAKNQASGNMDISHALSSGQGGTHSISLSTTASLGYIRDNYNIPITSPHNFLNIKASNNSATSFELFGIKIDFSTLGWRPVNP